MFSLLSCISGKKMNTYSIEYSSEEEEWTEVYDSIDEAFLALIEIYPYIDDEEYFEFLDVSKNEHLEREYNFGDSTIRLKCN